MILTVVQLMKLINRLKRWKNVVLLCDQNQTSEVIVDDKKIAEKSHSYSGFAFNVTRSFLDTYDPICRIEKCYVCQLQ